ncbi:MAG TPA: lysophospholipid acyltransferase family protein [Fimbriimonadaceae bacterium]|nr:lysophospholipid acyltransferase family protein [Fimbriimonadaceae bacterium]
MSSRSKQFRGRVIAGTLRLIQRWLLRMPYLKALRRGEAIGRLVWRLARRRRRVGESNLLMAFPGMSEQAARATCKRVFENFGRSSADFFLGLAGDKEQLERTTKVEGLEHFERAHSKGKGVILITGHFGNWERISAWLVHQGHKLAVIARDTDDQGINQLVNELREGPGTEVIPRGNAARPVIQRLRRNELVGILPDQNAREVFIPFFGKPAGTVLGPGVLAERTGAPVVPVFCRYVGEGRYTITFYPELQPEPGYDTKGEGTMRAINAQLEAVIRAAPDQWLWFHDRWRSARREGLL